VVGSNQRALSIHLHFSQYTAFKSFTADDDTSSTASIRSPDYAEKILSEGSWMVTTCILKKNSRVKGYMMIERRVRGGNGSLPGSRDACFIPIGRRTTLGL
jgi:hypothetical protein